MFGNKKSIENATKTNDTSDERNSWRYTSYAFHIPGYNKMYINVFSDVAHECCDLKQAQHFDPVQKYLI